MGMAIAHTLPQLLVARLVLGAMGAASTLAFIMAGRQDDPRHVRRDVAAVQLAMTLGQVLGPLGGAAVAARLGFRPSFVLGGVILLGSAAFVHWGVRLPATLERPRAAAAQVRPLDLVVPVALVLAVSNQLFFLTAVLPQVLPGLGVARGPRGGGRRARGVRVGRGRRPGGPGHAAPGGAPPGAHAGRRPAGGVRAVDGDDGAPGRRLRLRGRALPPGPLRGADLPARRGPHGAAGERRRDRRHQLRPDRRLVRGPGPRDLDPLRVLADHPLRDARPRQPGVRAARPVAAGSS